MENSVFDKREMLKYIGDFSQMFSMKDYCLNGGKAGGVRAVDVKNGSGLEFTVLPDRGMDIAWLSFKGVNFSYITKSGIVAPQFYDAGGIEFLRSFYAGFLTTCGLSNVGSPCNDNGESYGLHGRISNTPAEEVYAGTDWQDGIPVMKVKGKMREGRLFGENLVMTREIDCKYGENKLVITDNVENNGFREEPLMILYHFNLGYPLLDEDARLVLPVMTTTPRDEEAIQGIDEYGIFQRPTPGYKEQVFYHDLKAEDDGKTFAALINEKLNMGIIVKFSKNELPRLTQWKQMGEGEYVLGIEPCNCNVAGRKAERENGTLEYLKPGEIRKFSIEIEVIENVSEFT